MEKIRKYRKAILSVLQYYAAIKSPFMPEVENKVIADTQQHHYQLQRIGWYKQQHVHYTVFHFEIKEGKVWVHENRTDVEIDEELKEAGIAAKDIISGLDYPYIYSTTQQAVA